jgi:Rieske Fe-S protein
VEYDGVGGNLYAGISMTASHENRRTALARLVTTLGGLLTAGIAGLVGVVAAPARLTNPRTWRRAAAPADLPSNRPLTLVLTARDEDGWYTTTKQSVIFLDRDGSGYRALSATCAHLGCRVKWDETQARFLCPCHGGVYDRQGQVLEGPPPRGLERLNVRVNPDTSEIEVEL